MSNNTTIASRLEQIGEILSQVSGTVESAVGAVETLSSTVDALASKVAALQTEKKPSSTLNRVADVNALTQYGMRQLQAVPDGPVDVGTWAHVLLSLLPVTDVMVIQGSCISILLFEQAPGGLRLVIQMHIPPPPKTVLTLFGPAL